MISIKPIAHEEVLNELGAQYGAGLEGVIASDGVKTLGYCLYKIENACTVLYYATGEDAAMLDGVVRAAVAAGERAGAAFFSCRSGGEELNTWFSKLFPNAGQMPLENDELFGGCAH